MENEEILKTGISEDIYNDNVPQQFNSKKKLTKVLEIIINIIKFFGVFIAFTCTLVMAFYVLYILFFYLYCKIWYRVEVYFLRKKYTKEKIKTYDSNHYFILTCFMYIAFYNIGYILGSEICAIESPFEKGMYYLLFWVIIILYVIFGPSFLVKIGNKVIIKNHLLTYFRKDLYIITDKKYIGLKEILRAFKERK